MAVRGRYSLRPVASRRRLPLRLVPALRGPPHLCILPRYFLSQLCTRPRLAQPHLRGDNECTRSGTNRGRGQGRVGLACTTTRRPVMENPRTILRRKGTQAANPHTRRLSKATHQALQLARGDGQASRVGERRGAQLQVILFQHRHSLGCTRRQGKHRRITAQHSTAQRGRTHQRCTHPPPYDLIDTSMQAHHTGTTIPHL